MKQVLMPLTQNHACFLKPREVKPKPSYWNDQQIRILRAMWKQ